MFVLVLLIDIDQSIFDSALSSEGINSTGTTTTSTPEARPLLKIDPFLADTTHTLMAQDSLLFERLLYVDYHI